ncbi:general stress protein 13 [Clostridium tepidiprofundi DSM 19306]|uniref:General stress protein 13 n=1 Tax=Clostridium tepidiprofundi DSM 19306 TaxID=1121338 RepID=A0A151B378_9CLOT|nr:S1 domain-containing RNA-binding protein [Clostridium tepidiprofundi]KYH34374.1 general stress protein 13 [Clostridium tepidiprofundi DSM 19306]
MSLKPGNIVEGKVVNITKFGAFVEVEGKIGLLHISEISNSYVKDVSEYLKENDIVKVKIVSIGEDGKISLSIKQANLEEQKKSCKPEEVDWNSKKRKTNSIDFEDTLSKFLKESEEKFKDLKNYKNLKNGTYAKKKNR